MPIDDVNTRQNVEDSRVGNALATPTPTPTSTAIVTTTTASKPPHNADYYKKKKKKSGGFGLLKAALLMIRGGKEARKSLLATQNNKGSNANWKKLLGSVRPMHHLPKNAQSPEQLLDVQRAVDKIPPPASPVASSSGTMSQYASASSLRDLDNSSDDDEEDDPDVVFDAIRGDELIDTKADEFIAQFYKQIKLQNTNTNV